MEDHQLQAAKASPDAAATAVSVGADNSADGGVLARPSQGSRCLDISREIE
jgi:hypothetical protein